jgi:hypothetical protein
VENIRSSGMTFCGEYPARSGMTFCGEYPAYAAGFDPGEYPARSGILVPKTKANMLAARCSFIAWDEMKKPLQNEAAFALWRIPDSNR